MQKKKVKNPQPNLFSILDNGNILQQTILLKNQTGLMKYKSRSIMSLKLKSIKQA
ncbi:hypothetical protein HMPREF1403_00681 [Helicobacter pylori GAM201Ai]|nr:hypothetical protein HMPREF1403_00681 [Helicobacter pylori GAM201Ai]